MVYVKKLKELLKDELPYRLTQAERAIYKELVSDWSQVTTLPTRLRERLQSELPLEIPGKIFLSGRGDSAKALITLNDGFSVETVLMRHKDNRNTVCVSSQIGCSLNCLFCRTGKLGFKRNLTSEEIVKQVLFFSRYLKRENAFVTNIVFMGMGEPFLNYENVMSAIRILNNKNKFNIGARHISISTCGIPERICDFAKEGLQVNLAISLNAPNDEIRSKLMPINNKYPIRELLKAVKFYVEKTNRRVMLEYVMIQDLNDQPSHARELARLVKGLLCFVNLIPCNVSSHDLICLQDSWKFVQETGNKGNRANWIINETGGGKSYNNRKFDEESFDNILKPSTRKRVSEFKKILSENGITVTERFRFGSDIKGACGQLVYEKSFEVR